jgi:hypothetical protein
MNWRYKEGFEHGFEKAQAEASVEIGRLRAEVARLNNCHRIVAKQVGFYKPELPDFTKVEIHLGVLRAAERCAGLAPWESLA